MKYYLTCEADRHLVDSDWDGEDSCDLTRSWEQINFWEYETYNHVFKIHKKET